MPLRTAIISEKLGGKDAKDSTIIAREALAREHEVYEVRPHHISYVNNVLKTVAGIYKGRESNDPVEYASINLAEMDVIHFRPNPPVDMAYLTTLYLLDTIKNKTLIINNPEAIIKFPEKIFPLMFAEFMPPTIITQNFDEILEFAESHNHVVIKPLYEFGGNNVKKHDTKSLSKSADEIKKLIAETRTPLVCQKFLSNVAKGDKRIFYINGEIEGAFNRVPAEGNFLANTAHGSKLHPTEVTTREHEFSKLLKPVLVENGIFICGIDVIDGYVTEINITSPAGLGFNKAVYNTNPEAKLWDIIEAKLT